MSIFDVGRVCVKIAGRDAGNKCVVVEQLDNTYVLIDGATRRKKVNIKHLEPLDEMLKIKKGASHEEVGKAFEKVGVQVHEAKTKPSIERSKKQKKANNKPKGEKKTAPKKEKKKVKAEKQAE